MLALHLVVTYHAFRKRNWVLLCGGGFALGGFVMTGIRRSAWVVHPGTLAWALGRLGCIVAGAVLAWVSSSAVEAAECPTSNKREFKSSSYHFFYESLASAGSESDKYVFARCVQNRTGTSLFIDWKKAKLKGYVPGSDTSKSEVEFSPREKTDESSELWYGSRPDSLTVSLTRHKQESSLRRLLPGPSTVFAQPAPTSLRDLPLMKAIEQKWPQPDTKGMLRSYAVIGVPLESGAVSNGVVDETRLLRLAFASVSRIVGAPGGFGYEYLYSYQYLPSLASSRLPRSAAIHILQPSSMTMTAGLRAAGLPGRLANITEFPVLTDKVPSVIDKRSPRQRLQQIEILDNLKVVVATIPVAVWEPTP